METEETSGGAAAAPESTGRRPYPKGKIGMIGNRDNFSGGFEQVHGHPPYSFLTDETHQQRTVIFPETPRFIDEGGRIDQRLTEAKQTQYTSYYNRFVGILKMGESAEIDQVLRMVEQAQASLTEWGLIGPAVVFRRRQGQADMDAPQDQLDAMERDLVLAWPNTKIMVNEPQFGDPFRFKTLSAFLGIGGAGNPIHAVAAYQETMVRNGQAVFTIGEDGVESNLLARLQGGPIGLENQTLLEALKKTLSVNLAAIA